METKSPDLAGGLSYNNSDVKEGLKDTKPINHDDMDVQAIPPSCPLKKFSIASPRKGTHFKLPLHLQRKVDEVSSHIPKDCRVKSLKLQNILQSYNNAQVKKK